MTPFEAIVRAPEHEIDLGLAALALATVESPDLDPRPWVARLDELAERSGARGAGDAHEALGRLRTFLFDGEGFQGNADDYFDPRNSCLDHVLSRRLGIPITLSLVMMEVGRRVGLRIEGVGLPGHFVVRAHAATRSVLIDPFHAGQVLTEADAADVVTQAVGRSVPLTDEHFAAVTKRQLLARMLLNLKAIYVKREAWAKALIVIDWLALLDADRAGQLRDRGTVLVKLGKFQAGVAEWERYLTRMPHAPDAETLRGQLRRIRQAIASLN